MSYYLVNLHDELLRIITNLADLYSVLPANHCHHNKLWHSLQLKKEIQKDLLKSNFDTFFTTACDESIEVPINFFNSINFLNSEILKNISNLFDHENLSLSYCLKVCLVYERNLIDIFVKNEQLHEKHISLAKIFQELIEISTSNIQLLEDNKKK